MKKAVLLLGLLLLLGCQQAEKQPFEEFRTGTEGLRVTPVANLPPVRIFDDQDFDVVLEIENKGTYDIGSAGDKIYLSGFDPNIITGIPISGIQIPQMEGKSQFGPGGFDTISFKGVIRDLRSHKIDSYPVRLLTTACYGYQTIATTTVCIDPDPFSVLKQKACTPTNKGLGSQGGPVAVSNIQLEPSPRRTRFEITVSNVGGGEAFRPGAGFLTKCSPYATQGLKFDELNYVRLDDVSVAGVSIKGTCKPLDEGHIRLFNGQGRIFCDLSNIQGTSAFTTPITITLSHGYKQAQFRDVTILASR